MRSFRLLIYGLFLFLVLSSCKRAGKFTRQVIEKSYSHLNKNSNYFNKIEVKNFIKQFGLPKNSNKYLTNFSEKEMLSLAEDLKKYSDKPFAKNIRNNPEFLKAYQALSSSPNLRIKSDFLKSYVEQMRVSPNKIPVLNLPNIQNLNKESVDRKIKILNSKGASSGVSFKLKTLSHGKFKVSGIFPDFNQQTLYSTKMPKSMFEESNSVQGMYSTRKLQTEFKHNEESILRKLRELNKNQEYTEVVNGVKVKLSGEKLLERQIKDLSDPRKTKIFGFTWHHNERSGQMDLVIENIHNSIDHIGGQIIWASKR